MLFVVCYSPLPPFGMKTKFVLKCEHLYMSVYMLNIKLTLNLPSSQAKLSFTYYYSLLSALYYLVAKKPHRHHYFPLFYASKLAGQQNPINHSSINTTDAKETGNYTRLANTTPTSVHIRFGSSLGCVLVWAPNYSLRVELFGQ